MLTHAENNVTNEQKKNVAVCCFISFVVFAFKFMWIGSNVSTVSWVAMPLNREASHDARWTSIKLSGVQKKEEVKRNHSQSSADKCEQVYGLSNLRVHRISPIVNYRVDNLFSLLSKIIGINDDWRLQADRNIVCASSYAGSSGIPWLPLSLSFNFLETNKIT